MKRKNLAAVAAVAVGMGLWFAPSIGGQSSKADAESHLKAYAAHVKLAQASPYKTLLWSWIGPTNVGGRMTDIAVADKGSARRIYAASCCGGAGRSQVSAIGAAADSAVPYQSMAAAAALTQCAGSSVAPTTTSSVVSSV